MTNNKDQEFENELMDEIHHIHHKLKSITNDLVLVKDFHKDIYHAMETLINEIKELKIKNDKT
tara:strand:+ start:257 stop:445 length:189 start_codon:yes stop_codon:yes gene_type:complete